MEVGAEVCRLGSGELMSSLAGSVVPSTAAPQLLTGREELAMCIFIRSLIRLTEDARERQEGQPPQLGKPLAHWDVKSLHQDTPKLNFKGYTLLIYSEVG